MVSIVDAAAAYGLAAIGWIQWRRRHGFPAEPAHVFVQQLFEMLRAAGPSACVWFCSSEESRSALTGLSSYFDLTASMRKSPPPISFERAPS